MRRYLRNGDWEKYNDLTKLKPTTNNTPEQIENSIITLQNCINDALDIVAPLKTDNLKYQLTKEIRKLIKRRYTWRRRAASSRDPRVQEQYQQAKDELKQAIKKHNSSTWCHILDSKDNHSKKLWGIQRALKRPGTYPTTHF